MSHKDVLQQMCRRTFAVGLMATVVLGCSGAAEPAPDLASSSRRPWSSELLRDRGVWPYGKAYDHIAVTSAGLRVEVGAGRGCVIASRSDLALPDGWGRLRVRVAAVGGEGSWFVRLSGELREPGKRRTAPIAEDETGAGEYAFDVDPRLVQRRDSPMQLQLGVEGPPGAFAVFEDVAFLPPVPRPNCLPRHSRQPGQRDIAAVELMPNLPVPFDLVDWRTKARDYDRFVFNLKAQGEFQPLAWLDESRVNIDRATFGMPSYVGDGRRTAQHPGSQEGITCMGAVLGATLAGIDKRRGEHDYVRMCEAWFNRANGLNLVLNHQKQETGGSFWYGIWPHIVFYALADRYPDTPGFRHILQITADRWSQACADLADPGGIPDFNHTSHNFRTRKPVDNGRWNEPDAAAGVAWIEYAAWITFHDPRYLNGAENCVRFLESCRENPYYEVLLPYGTLTAARLNAEQGHRFDVDRFLNWSFGISDCRGGWGVTVGRWGQYDCDGLVGSIDNRGGYAFAMNTFAQAGALVPLVRYDSRYARAIGKWMLNLANAARLFYPGALPPTHQTSGFWHDDPGHVIAYEGLRCRWQGKSPCATGDPVAMHWGPKTDLSLYGSGYVGILGSIVRPTDVPGILQLDCLATDFFREPAYPTSLCYNPYPEQRRVRIAIGPKPVDLYDAVSHQFMAREVRDSAQLGLPADSAAVVVAVPAGVTVTRDANRRFANAVVIDWSSRAP